MKIILSPTKTMSNSNSKVDNTLSSNPVFLKEAIKINSLLKSFSKLEIQKIMKLSKNLSNQTYEDIHLWNLHDSIKSHSVHTYQGTAFKSLSPGEWNSDSISFAQENLLILSGLYGVLKPYDVIDKYRLEMGLKFQIGSATSLTNFWKDKIINYFNQFNENETIINLASKEYFDVINISEIRSQIINCTFYERSNDTLKIIGNYAKSARGKMAKFIIENQLDNIEDLKNFNEMNYKFSNDISNQTNFVFINNN
jgi:hypothetical protein